MFREIKQIVLRVVWSVGFKSSYYRIIIYHHAIYYDINIDYFYFEL